LEEILLAVVLPRYRAPKRVVAILFAVVLSLGSHQAFAWQTAHGKPDNTGFADVSTAPAANPLASPPQVGGIAAGAGPVIAPDGTVYVINGRGKLMSFRADGTPG
jgi:hypothetical protein